MASIQLRFNKALKGELPTILVFHTAIYVRLSKADENKSKDEQSRSISNQKEICMNYLSDLQETDKGIIKYEFINYYIDDGYTGSNFDRPAFNSLKNDIIEGKIDMVITKDLSRLGREHIESDDYIEKWFPEHNTRYVSILDNIDTFSENTSNEIAPILNWANERHNSETSKKIKRTFREKINKGLFMGSQPPYGYIRNPSDKHKLVVDKSVKEVIVSIFTKAKEGMCITKIAEYLTQKGIPIPSIHTHSNRGVKTKTYLYWDPNTVKDILTNEMYLGHMVQGKTTKLSFKSKRITYIPKEDWIKVLNTHEPIIDEDTFSQVQLILKDISHDKKSETLFLLKSLLKCRECGHTMYIQKNEKAKNAYTICNYYKKHSKCDVCTPHRFNYNVIEESILNIIKKDCRKYLDKISLGKMLLNKEKTKSELDSLQILMKESTNTIKRYKKQIEVAYFDKLNEDIDEELFQSVKEKFNQKIEEEKALFHELKEKLKILKKRGYRELNYDEIINDFLSLKNLNKSTIVQIIDKICIGEDGTIDVFLRYNLKDIA